jgi:hypothetical protein
VVAKVGQLSRVFHYRPLVGLRSKKLQRLGSSKCNDGFRSRRTSRSPLENRLMLSFRIAAEFRVRRYVPFSFLIGEGITPLRLDRKTGRRVANKSGVFVIYMSGSSMPRVKA